MSAGFRVTAYTPYRSELNQLAGIVRTLNNTFPDKDDEEYHNLEVRNVLSVPGTYTGSFIYVDKIIAREGIIDNLDFSGALDNIVSESITSGTGIFDNLIANGSYINYLQVVTTGYFKSISTEDLTINNDLIISDELTIQGTATFNGLLYVPNSGSFRGLYVTDDATVKNNLYVGESGGFHGLYVRDNGYFGSITSQTGTLGNLTLQDLTINGSITLNSNNAYKLGSQFWKILSDKSTKTDIETLQEYDRMMLLKLVDEMEIKKYRYKHQEEKEIGIIADEIEKINPALITMKDGLKHVDLGSLIYGLVLKVQNIQKDIDNLYNKIEKKEN